MTNLSLFFGDKVVGELGPTLCQAYVTWRSAQKDKRYTKSAAPTVALSTVKRELVTLSAALNYCYRDRKLERSVVIAMPDIPDEVNQRFLTRSELARLILGALGWNLKTGMRNKFRINRHVARFIILGYYSGTRHDAILKLGWMPSTYGGWIDLENGLLFRRPQDAVETAKRRTTCVIPDCLMAHLQRWKRLTARFPVERDGMPITGQLKRSWHGAVALAGLDDGVTPHVLRHTCITHMLQRGESIFDVSGYVGASEAVIRKHYGHHELKHQRTVANRAFSRQPLPHVSPMKPREQSA
jgi:integrase